MLDVLRGTVKQRYLLVEGAVAGVEKRSKPVVALVLALPPDWEMGDTVGVCIPISFKRCSYQQTHITEDAVSDLLGRLRC